MNENSWLYWSALIAYIPAGTIGCFHEWKFMALLKPSSIVQLIIVIIAFPWMKIHGSIEAHGEHHSKAKGICHVSMNENSWLYWSLSITLPPPWPLICFHEWKFMALLKLSSSPLSLDFSCSFHEWKFMALLKRRSVTYREACQHMFPWMKIHGSIEAYAGVSSQPHPGGFHEWKFMALLKHPGAADRAIIADQVSMNENSWLYWSEEQTVNDGRNKSIGFHEWKFMALLKRIFRG